ncbi:P-loop containing nucleoside triphosphate hydrolase protein [Aaosphaeria arxii CBS 175.79]|uniref:P-loop containing nucleoside triphosphate hydrolase protein n=1 Tax=Aaosphaeria arxii CBS 175.79 TaxID=1450172 RepID=A0A6A5XCV0_9PLEO|nr:P-loop containing nucleoside triphosphate hydrolase protein [Aaosphaeria arxii CBS 175.79]KAF2010750.1 P-loop containing nucleoside triphosphate hydrolase protein [Aaosphaeria arxii CBS 175.79]
MEYLDAPPEITVLLLGDSEVGKSTFLSRLSIGGRPQDDGASHSELPALRDMDQPFQFNLTLYRRPYALAFYDTASPTNYTLLEPSFLILCFDITRRDSLLSLKQRWRELVNSHFDCNDALPVMVLGLKRDLRKEWTEEESRDGGRGPSVMPQEGLLVAQELRADLYAECSAVTGELCRQVLEDIAKTAAKTTTEKGAKTEGGCLVM